MNIYREFILEARGSAQGTSGFGRPQRVNNRKPTKEQLANWRGRSEAWQKSYLEKYPNSMFRDQPKRGSILTRSKKLSQSIDAKEMVSKTTDYLRSIGVKNKGNNIQHAKTAIKNIRNFLNTGNRNDYISSATEKFKSFMSKLSKKDQLEAEDETKAILAAPSVKPSKTLSKRGKKGIIIGLVGLAVGAAVFGGVATGFLPPDVIAFMGVKALDAAVESIRGLVGDGGGITALLAGSVISDFFRSKDSDDYVRGVEDGLRKKVGDVDDEEEETEKTNNNASSSTNNVEKKP